MTLDFTQNDQLPIFILGSRTIRRKELHAQIEQLTDRLRRNTVERVLVFTNDPSIVLRAIASCSAVAADLWIAHTTVSPELLTELIEQFHIQLILRDGADHQYPANSSTTTHAASGRIHLMTSGTTGKPKIAKHSLNSIVSGIRNAVSTGSNQVDRWLLTYQPTAFAGLQVVLTAALSAGAVVIPEDRSPLGFFTAAKDANATHISGTPTFWRSFLMIAGPDSLPNLRQITLGGEMVDQATLDRLKRVFPSARLTHIYATTEAGVVFSVQDGRAGFPAEWLKQPLKAGIKLRILDGVLQVMTPRRMQGYAATEEHLQHNVAENGWWSTGDLVEVLGDRVFFLGRQDKIINVGGAKVFPQVVEAFLLSLRGILEAKVNGLPNPISGFLVAAEVVLAPGMDPEASRLRILTECRAGLPSYQVPRLLQIVDSIKTLDSGKKG
jgi:acyl-coenzyme A synthetase/AMP-(fatty) acid ligase